jgi:hypothetical protein
VERLDKRLFNWASITATAGLIVLIGCGSQPSGPPLTRAECQQLQMAFDGAMYLAESLPPGNAERARRLAEADRYHNQMRDGGCYQ